MERANEILLIDYTDKSRTKRDLKLYDAYGILLQLNKKYEKIIYNDNRLISVKGGIPFKADPLERVQLYHNTI